MKHLQSIILASAMMLGGVLTGCQNPEAQSWPKATSQNKPGVRWWWMGSAVDEANLNYLVKEYAGKGIGTVEITPIYGVQGNDSNEIPYLSDKWMHMLKVLNDVAKETGVEVDMNNGTGWPFGGPSVTVENAAHKFVIDTYNLAEDPEDQNVTVARPRDPKQQQAPLMKLMLYKGESVEDLTASVDSLGNITAELGNEGVLYGVYCGNTFQKVKRAAPGGEGLVIDHFDKQSVEDYLAVFTKAFEGKEQLMPTTFFNDSYEVYGADCTPRIFAEFEARRGYKLEEHLPELLAEKAGHDEEYVANQVITDYNETLSDLLLENFTKTWAAWAHQHNATVRNQAHGSPANLIDLYAEVDIPECEGFGLSDFGIQGLRTDSGMVKKNDSDFSMLKWASSGAHITGKTLTSSETFTWLTEHFRTSFSQCKPDLDLMFAAGVNRMFFHGTTYSPKEAEWPGWKFYASMDMSPTNPLWADADAFTQYIQRTQGMLQMGKPDNDFLIYLPIYDIWNSQGKKLLQLTIHHMAEIAPKFIETINAIDKAGFDVDYISDRYLWQTESAGSGALRVAAAGKRATDYKAIILPDVKQMPQKTRDKLKALAMQGVKIVVIGNDVVPELQGDNVIKGDDYAAALAQTGAVAEQLRTQYGLKVLRRQTDKGALYFVANLTPEKIDEYVTLNGLTNENVLFYDAVTGAIAQPETEFFEGVFKIRLQLASGSSMIIRQLEQKDIAGAAAYVYENKPESMQSLRMQKWQLDLKGAEGYTAHFDLDALQPWTELPDTMAQIMMGTGSYTTTFEVEDASGTWWLDLGDVRETAKVTINGKYVTTLWAVPYVCEISSFLKSGENSMTIEVTNLPANYISHLDRMGVKWRKFKEINIVDINYKRNNYANWKTVPGGLNSTVTLYH